MQRQLVITEDGSHTIAIPESNITYHSMHGAIQESMHVFIEAGFKFRTEMPDKPDQLNVLEFGFGTGLNALLTLIESIKTRQHIHYTAIESFPLTIEESGQLNYCALLHRMDLQSVFDKMHSCDWEKHEVITSSFELFKTKSPVPELKSNNLFDIIYFDAFDPATQPELWTSEIFSDLYKMMSNNGVFVTYSSKGDVRRALKAD
ncbi:MAG: tRNA (5-methylaminomethyl-2-thiouridine)(34)-methyltransferase MnmD [Chitinophagaceae bacterium]